METIRCNVISGVWSGVRSFSRFRVSRLAVPLMAMMLGPLVHAQVINIDPDLAADNQDISAFFSGVTLSTTEPAAVFARPSPPTNVATIGPRVFGWTNQGFGDTNWSRVNSPDLVATFTFPVTQASIDCYTNTLQTCTLSAYDSSNNLLGSKSDVNVYGSTVTITVSSPNVYIAKVVASLAKYGGEDFGVLDDLVLTVPNPPDFFIRYAANLDKGDSTVSFTNAGTLSGFDPAGRICVNTYTFDPAEEMISCCSCPVTPNGLNSLSVRNDLISNTLTPGVPRSVVIKLLPTVPTAGVCNAAAASASPSNLVRGMRAWGSTLHALPGSPGAYGSVETPFSKVELSATELQKLTQYCGFIQANGSGFGICKSCRVGALGGSQQ